MFIAMSPPAIVQSFDCRKAASAVEKMICADRELSALDAEMAAVFAEARRRNPGIARKQQAWLRAERNECTIPACLRSAYRERVEYLKAAASTAFSLEGLAGDWTRIGGSKHAPAGVTIANVSARGFDFELLTTNGMHVGQIDGTAARTVAEAVYVDPETKCRVTFRRSDKRLSVETDNCMSMGGMGVRFDGVFGMGEPPEPWPTLTDLGVLASGVTEQAFAALTDKDYELFLSSFHLIGDEEDLDNLGAKVVLGMVRGSATEQEAIVMSTPDGRIFAAVIDEDVVKYFSTDPPFKTKLPKTIEDWRQRFAEKKVVFVSR